MLEYIIKIYKYITTDLNLIYSTSLLYFTLLYFTLLHCLYPESTKTRCFASGSLREEVVGECHVTGHRSVAVFVKTLQGNVT